jgi:rhamnosyltransferase
MTDESLPSFAVLLAAHNGCRYLQEQVDSILAQQDVSLKLFISVDRSTDGTEIWAQRFAKVNEHVVLLPLGERYGSAARNFFRLLRDADFSSFNYVAFADQDDIWLPEKLSRAHEVLKRTSADAYSSDLTAFWPNRRKKQVRKSQPQVAKDFLFEAAGPGCTYVMRKDLAHTIRARLCERWEAAQQIELHDWFAYAFVRANGYQWVIDNYSGILYRQHENNQVGVNAGWRAFRHRIKKVLGGWGLAQAELIAQLVGLGDDPFVECTLGGGRLGLLRLALHANSCRRRRRDKILFFIACLVLSANGSQK